MFYWKKSKSIVLKRKAALEELKNKLKANKILLVFKDVYLKERKLYNLREVDENEERYDEIDEVYKKQKSVPTNMELKLSLQESYPKKNGLSFLRIIIFLLIQQT